VSLQVEAGERLLLLGPNGAGKSTFIRVFAGLMRPAHGAALVHGQPARRARSLVGVVSHATYLYDELTALENLRFYGELYDVADPVARAAELLDQVGLSALAGERVGRMSRGQQQRVTIARALLHDPPLLLLDEPDTGLDLAAFALLEALTTQGGHTVVLTTHNLAAGLRLGTRVAVLSHGRVEHEQRSVSPSDAQALADLLQRLAAA
jgi:ABC-type multidrug transport system ATPase subunit